MSQEAKEEPPDGCVLSYMKRLPGGQHYRSYENFESKNSHLRAKQALTAASVDTSMGLKIIVGEVAAMQFGAGVPLTNDLPGTTAVATRPTVGPPEAKHPGLRAAG